MREQAAWVDRVTSHSQGATLAGTPASKGTAVPILSQPIRGSALRTKWIEAFTVHIGSLQVPAEPADVAALAAYVYDFQGELDPIEIAQAQADMGPPDD
jgi:hypothetical protein